MEPSYVWLFRAVPPDAHDDVRDQVAELDSLGLSSVAAATAVARWREGERPWFAPDAFDAEVWREFERAFARTSDELEQLAEEGVVEVDALAAPGVSPAAVIWAAVGPRMEERAPGPLGVVLVPRGDVADLATALEELRLDPCVAAESQAIIAARSPGLSFEGVLEAAVRSVRAVAARRSGLLAFNLDLGAGR